MNYEFKFMINARNKAISLFIIKTFNHQLIQIKAYDKMADLAYRRLQKDTIVFIYGKLDHNFVQAIKIK